MSATNINKMEEEIDKTSDKKQIEAEEKEFMLKVESETIEAVAELKPDNDGPVKAALSGDVTEEGREVKPKFIPIGAIKMPGFFTRNSDKDKAKDDDGVIEKDGEEKNEDSSKPKRRRFQFLHTCPFTQFMHHPQNENEDNTGNKKTLGIFNLKYPKMLQKRNQKNPEATLASMETLEDKLDTPNDGLENIKLSIEEPEEGKVSTRLPLRERIRQKKFIIDDIIVGVVALLVLLAVIIGVAVGASAGPPRIRPLRLGKYMTTVTSCGHVEGIWSEGVYKFYGIPYAEPPVGKNRFKYAQPLNNISLCWNDTLKVHEPTPECIQVGENNDIFGEEDCLTLDIITPKVTYDSPLPVVVLIGTNTLTGGKSPAQPSALYARTKEVIFVRPKFRLGALGFVALQILANEKYPPTSGNYGLSDVLVALKWIKNNIRHFGGDSESVTLLGHRAGATLTAALTTVKDAHKLYSRVWLASPSVIFPGVPLEQEMKIRDTFRVNTMCETVECLRNLSISEIFSATPDIWRNQNAYNLPRVEDKPTQSWLVLDGELLRSHAYNSWEAQKESKKSGKDKLFKPMIFGTTEHSSNNLLLRERYTNWTPELVEKVVNDSVIGAKNLTEEVFQHFNKTYEGLVKMISYVCTLCPLVTLARMRLDVPLYVVQGVGAVAGVDADVEAILGTFDSVTPQQRRYMSAMQQLFYYYVGHGNLPGPETPLIAVAQDLLPLHGLPACDLFIRHDLVPRYARID